MTATALKLCEAVMNEDSKEVEHLLKCGADPNLVLPSGTAAIHLAAGKESESALRCLTLILQHNGDPNVRSIEALTPVHVAASWGCCKALIFLLRKGGDPTLNDQDGNTALDLALMESNRRCVVALQEYSERSSYDCPNKTQGYFNSNSCSTDTIPEMSSITALLESSYDHMPLNSTKISPFMSPQKKVSPGNCMNHAVISSQTEWFQDDTKHQSRKSTGIINSKLHLDSKPVTLKPQTINTCEDSSVCWQSDLINEGSLLINTVIERPTICTLMASSSHNNGSGKKIGNDITLSNHFRSHICNSDVFGGENVEVQKMSDGNQNTSCQTECYTSPWENSSSSHKNGWDLSTISRNAHNNQTYSKVSAHLNKVSVTAYREGFPELKKDMLLMDTIKVPGISTSINDCKEETTPEDIDVSFQSETLAINHESKMARTTGTLCTSPSTSLSVGGNRCRESNSQECHIDVQNVMLLTGAESLNALQQTRKAVQNVALTEIEESCPDTVPVSFGETQSLVKNNLSVNHTSKDNISAISCSVDTLIYETDEVNVKEMSDTELCDQFRKMMLATKVFQSSTNTDGEKSPCFFTPRSKRRLLSSKIRNNSSLFENSVEMPRRGNRVRSPVGISASPSEFSELLLRQNSCTNSVLVEQNTMSDTIASDDDQTILIHANHTLLGQRKNKESIVSISDFLTDDLSSDNEVKPSSQFKQTSEVFESEWLTEDADSESTGETASNISDKEKSLSASLVNGSFLHSTVMEDTKRPRFSFSRLSCVPKIENSVEKSCLTSTINESGSQEVPLSPGGRPANVCQVEPVEYLYMDNENGHALIERHIPCKDQCGTNISENVEDTLLYDWKNFRNSSQKVNKALSQQPANRVAVELYRLSNNEISRRLRELGEDNVQVTSQSRKTCILLLDKLLKEQSTSGQAGVSFDYSPELSLAFRDFHFPDCNGDEATISLEFDQPDKTRKWREGVLKSSFNYLLLDPRVTQNLPARHHSISQLDCFRTFVRAIFYVGKGKRSRPYCHLYEALTYYKGSNKPPCLKVQHIMDIWKSGQGVLSLHCFQNTIPSEAYTREACMVDAIGLKKLSNQKKGVYYGQAQYWTPTRRRSLGVHMLYKAMQIFLAEGERQLRPTDIRTK